MLIETPADFRRAYPYWSRTSWYPADFCKRMRKALSNSDDTVQRQESDYRAWYEQTHGREYDHQAALELAARVQNLLEDDTVKQTAKMKFENLTNESLAALKLKLKKYGMAVKVHCAGKNAKGQTVFSGAAYA